MNVGIKADYAYVNHHNNFKAGMQVQHTLLNENFFLGVTDPSLIVEQIPGWRLTI